MSHTTSGDTVTRRHRPKTLTVFVAAFAAGAVLAYGVDRVVDVHVVQVEPQVESEPIFVALRSLPQGAPLTVWDVALKDWPKAMLPTTALRADAALEGMVLRHPIREGQPLLSVQLVRDGATPPIVGMAALPPAVGPAATSPTTPGGAPAAAVTPSPAAVETFVPAAPADAPVAAAQTAPITDIAAVPAAPPLDAAAGEIVSEAIAADTDVDPSDLAAPAAGVMDSEAVAAEVASSVQPTAREQVAVRTLVSEVVPPPAESPIAGPAPTISGPLVAPVPMLPSTDIGRSLASAGRASPAPAATIASVLDRTTQAPAPQAPATAPRYHLVVPERVALAADASFTQRPATTANSATQQTTTARPNTGAAQNMPARQNMTPRQNMTAGPSTSASPNTSARQSSAAGANATPDRAAAEAARIGGRRSRMAAPSAGRQDGRPDGRQDRSNASARKTGPTTRQPAPVGKPGVTPPADEPRSSRSTGLGAWFPFSGGSRQR